MLSGVDPRTRLTIVAVVSTLAVAFRDVVWLFGVLAATALALLVLGGAGLTAGRFRRLLPLFFVLMVIQSAFAPSGDTLISAGSVALITTGGVIQGLSVVLRMLIIISSASLLLAVDPLKLVMGLVRLRIPYELAFMTLLGARFLPVLVDDVGDALTAIQLRGVRLKEVPLGRRLGVYRSVFLPVVASSMIRARKTATAMEARAFRAYPRRTYLEDLSLSGTDVLIMAGALGAGLTCLAIYFWGG